MGISGSGNGYCSIESGTPLWMDYLRRQNIGKKDNNKHRKKPIQTPIVLENVSVSSTVPDEAIVIFHFIEFGKQSKFRFVFARWNY